MTDALREELARIGEGAPRASMPADLWTRGRRARRRDRVVAGGAVLSVLVVLSGLGLVLGLPGRSDVPPTAPVGDAVPSVIHPVPQRFSQLRGGHDVEWDPKVAEEDLAIGTGSVAFVSGGRPLPVVITVADGGYHLLKLPGWVGSNVGNGVVEGAPLALAPDGRWLAYGWYDPKTLGTDKRGVVTAGVRIVDLETGSIRTVELAGERGVSVGTIRWSPDSRWLVWHGQALATWTEDQAGGGHMVAGRIAPGARTSDAIGVSRGGGEQLVIDNRGTVSWTDGSGWRSIDRFGQASDVTDVMTGQTSSAGAVSPSGGTVALANGQPSRYASYFQWTHLAVPGGDAVPFIGQRNLPADDYPEGATVEPLGWIDDEHVLSLVTSAHDVERNSGWTNGSPELAVMSLRDGRTRAYDVVARVERGDEQTGQVRELTVAVDLMSLDRPTRDFPAPEWPWSDERKVAVFGGAGLAVVAVLVFVVSYRRGRRLG